MEWPVTYRRKMRFSDTDAQGIAHFGTQRPVERDGSRLPFQTVVNRHGRKKPLCEGRPDVTDTQ